MANIKYADPSYTAIAVPATTDNFMVRRGDGTDGRVAIGTLQAANLSGTYAARPAASTVRAGTTYYATDVLETYASNGSAWSVYGGAGVARAYAESSSSFSTSSTALVDVPGLTATILAGERPLIVSWGANMRTVGGGAMTLALLVGGAQVSQVVYSGASYQYNSRSVRVSPTPGASTIIKVQVSVTSGSADIFGSASDKPFLLAVNS